jgi:hypothetical protein
MAIAEGAEVKLCRVLPTVVDSTLAFIGFEA